MHQDVKFRRYDNDDEARTQGTYIWSTWALVMHEWESSGIALFGVVPADSPQANSRAATEARTRDERRRRVRELIRAGVHNARDRQQILRTEDTASGMGGHHSNDTAHTRTPPQRNALYLVLLNRGQHSSTKVRGGSKPTAFRALDDVVWTIIAHVRV